ncbi:MAG: biopolymer transporter ExbD [Sphaerochaeta sp.]|nr:biopolymer transporter ExbD [Sphaerochaeta sp.]
MRKKRFPPPTAMTDIAFLLLLFFLILAISTHLLPIPLTPAQGTPSSVPEEADHLLLVTREGELYYQGNRVIIEEVPLAEEFSLLADKETPFRILGPIIEALKQRGVTTLHCIVEQSQ